MKTGKKINGWFVFWGTLCVLVLVSAEKRCIPGEPCFPSEADFTRFEQDLDGYIVYPNDARYSSTIMMYNIWRIKYPFAVVVAKTTKDVQTSVLFARKFNLYFHVKTSGHDFNGRSTASNSLEINLSNMTKLAVTLNSSRSPNGEIMVESGNRWLKVYEEVDKYKRIIVGGSAHTVSMAGYTLGGGHSPLCRTLGMAVDNLLEVEMVSVDGSIVRATADHTYIISSNGSMENTTNNDIFWALSGGGGGTFGIATRFYFKLHLPPTKLVRLSLIYPVLLPDGTNIGVHVMKKWAEMLPGLPSQWGGYFIVQGAHEKTYNTTGSLTFFLNHFGPNDTESRRYLDQLVELFPTLRIANYAVYDRFWEYEKSVYDPPAMNGYVFNSLLHNGSFTDTWIDFVIKTVLDRSNPNIGASFTGTLTGGKMMDVALNATAVHPGFRRSLMSLSGGIGWALSYNDHIPTAVKIGADLQEQLKAFGDGMYPNEAGADVKDWQQNFWGNNYDRLLRIKREWDPDNYLVCRECVGWGLTDKDTISSSSNPVPSTTYSSHTSPISVSSSTSASQTSSVTVSSTFYTSESVSTSVNSSQTNPNGVFSTVYNVPETTRDTSGASYSVPFIFYTAILLVFSRIITM